MKVMDFLDIIERLAPADLALDWDNPGLQVGDASAEVAKAALALDPTSENIQKALDLDCQLLITHHPLIFKPLKKISLQDPLAAPVLLAASRGLSVVSAHTNWDAAGVALELAGLLGLADVRPLEAQARTFLKLVVFVPPSHAETVRRTVFETGAGVVGGYGRCWFQSPGRGGFKVPAGAAPFSGKPGEEHETAEERLEIILPPGLREGVARAVAASHPYEEPAYEFHEIRTTGAGFGVLGDWDPPRRCERILQDVLGPLGLFAGPDPGAVSRVALLPGSGGDYVLDAKRAGAQLYVTGELGHHQALLAGEIGLAVYAGGHFETERPSMTRLERELRREAAQCEAPAQILLLEESPPFYRP
ncbi:MAG: Nif3-like dinuclear metal center hexameric protein [Deltaproteobacteria bacterium]|jgi:dinuclear metal center YbgI/SA1388 family protein|nr:Nif3-like dinuclear metal center hexameric protein [Deltaproteobacteria bacterium]